MKKHNLFLLTVLLIASLLTPLKAQWNLAYNNPGSEVRGFHFVDTLNGWFAKYPDAQIQDKILRTTDGGFTFEIQTVPVGSYPLNDVYMEDLQNGRSAGGAMFSNGPGVILKTSDGGQNWVNQNHQKNGTWNAIAKVGNTMWFVGGHNNNGAILKTSDNGVSWQVTYYPGLNIFGDIEVLDEQNIIICGNKGIYRTTNSGVDWYETTGNTNPDYWFYRLAFIDGNLGYCIGSIVSGSWESTLYVTTNGGFTWSQRYVWPEGQKQGLSVVPATGKIFVGGWLTQQPSSRGILKSTDNGFSWTLVLNTGNFNPWHLYTPNGYTGWAACFGGAIYRYDYVEPPVVQSIPDALIQLGESFAYQVQATGMGLEYSMSGHPTGLNIGLYSGLIQGTPIEGGSFPVTVTVQDTDINVVNTIFNLRVNRKPQFIPPLPPTVCWVDSFYHAIISAQDNDDDTLTFSSIQLPSFLQLIPNEPSPAAILQGTPAITDTGFHNTSIMVSDGYGGSDTLNFVLQVTEYLELLVSPITDQLVQFGQEFTYQVEAFGLGIKYYLSGQPEGLSIGLYSGLISGTPEQGGLFNITVTVLDTVNNTANTTFALRVNRKPQFVQPYPPGIAWVDSLYEGLLSASDADNDSLIFTALQKPGFLELISNPPSPDYTALLRGTPSIADTGSHSISIMVSDVYEGADTLQYTLVVDIITGINPTAELPTEFILYQNYPNPFNPETKIKFAIPKADSPLPGGARGGLVKLKVYNILGDEITILINKELTAGIYEVGFNASGLASGIYFYRLTAGEYSDTKKFILLR